MSKTEQIEALSAQISGFARTAVDAAPEQLQAICSQIKKLRYTKEERAKLFEKLQLSFTLFCNLHPEFLAKENGQNLLLNYCEAFAQFRQNLLSDQQLKNLISLTVQIDFTKLSPAQLRNLAANFDKIGFGIASPFKDIEVAQNFLQQGLRSLQHTKYKGEEWTKNAMHFLIHCRNLGLMSGKVRSTNVEILRAVVADISTFINQNEFDFKASDAQASLDVLLYGRHSLKSKNLDSAIEKVAQLVGEKKDDSSKTHLAIFKKIVKFLENKKGGDDEWKHLAKKDEEEKKFTYAGIIEIEVESDYLTQSGLVLKRGDIVVRNLTNGEIILVIEIDGPTHFLTKEIKTGKTQARDRFATKLLGENRVIIIDADSFTFFRSLQQQQNQSKAELDFLVRVQQVLQSELDKTPQQSKAGAAAAATTSKPEAGTAAAEPTQKAESEKTKAPETKAAAVTKPAVKIKTKAERRAESLAAFWEVLSGTSDDNIEEILRDPSFYDIAPDDIRHPARGEAALDFAIKKLSTIVDPKQKTEYEDLIKTLWILGFEQEDKSASIASDELQRVFRSGESPVLKSEKRTHSLSRILSQANRGNFHFVNAALLKDGLPSELSQKEEFQLFQIAKLCLRQGDAKTIKLFRAQPWFEEIEERIFAEAVEDSDDQMAAIFLANHNADFFANFFSNREDLLRKIYDFKFPTASALEQRLEHIDLFNKVAQSLLDDLDSWRKKDMVLFSKVVLASISTSSDVLAYKAFFYYHGIGVKEDKTIARKLMLEAIEKPSKNRKANIVLLSLFDEDNNSTAALKLTKTLLKEDISGEFHYYLSCKVNSEAERIRLLKKAAELKHPKSMGLIAVHYITGSYGEKKDIPKAISLLEEAIAGGDVESITNLGTIYYEGDHPTVKGIAANKKAFELFCEAEQKSF